MVLIGVIPLSAGTRMEVRLTLSPQGAGCGISSESGDLVLPLTGRRKLCWIATLGNLNGSRLERSSQSPELK